MGGGKYVGGREAAAAAFLCLRARTQQNAPRHSINTPIMAAPAAMPSIAPCESPLCEELEVVLKLEPELDCEAKLFVADAV